MLPKLDGKPVEKLAVNGIFTLNAEVFRSLHNPGAEIVLPDPVDLHPGGERVLRRHQPFGQTKSILGLAFGNGGQELGQGELHLGRGLEILPSRKNGGFTRLSVAHHHRSRELIASIGVKLPRDGVVLR